jgi:hypothetical protein
LRQLLWIELIDGSYHSLAHEEARHGHLAFYRDQLRGCITAKLWEA